MTDEVTIPAGMKAWDGGDCPPDDWTCGDPVLLRKGWTVPEPARWNHSPADTHPHDYDIIAYTPMTPEPAQPAESPEARAIDTAPKDGTMLRLLVDYSNGGGPLEDEHPLAWTIGFNSLDNTGVDEWKFAGWCWTHDHFSQGSGEPVGWLPWTNPPTGGDAR